MVSLKHLLEQSSIPTSIRSMAASKKTKKEPEDKDVSNFVEFYKKYGLIQK